MTPDEITNPEFKDHKFQSDARNLHENTYFKLVSQDLLDSGGEKGDVIDWIDLLTGPFDDFLCGRGRRTQLAGNFC